MAILAGVSVDYYARLERGRSAQPSAQVLDALAGILGLDAVESEHRTGPRAGRSARSGRCWGDGFGWS
ncbi:helix-turn-helix transcriptional regulator [Nocardia sp. NPDC051463]|uniref:helix-turn-helix domain-containing protein n=1 Tax=Nocardia sp. NPDC051463 TaxID=3154845 RepID=UPI00341A035A